MYRAVCFGLALLAGSLARLPAPGLQGAHPVVEFLDGLDERGDQAAVVDLLASLLVGRHQLQEDLLDSWAITWAIMPGPAAWLRGAHCRYHRGVGPYGWACSSSRRILQAAGWHGRMTGTKRMKLAAWTYGPTASLWQASRSGGQMGCLSCGFENPGGRRFCSRCGSSLALTCPSCGAGVAAEDRFCGECGAALGAEPALSHGEPPGATPGPKPRLTEAERRLVSVLFADLVGFTTLSEGATRRRSGSC